MILLLQRSKVVYNKGYSLITWTAVFTVVVATILFIRLPFKRALQQKVTTTADYLLWTKWANTLEEKNELIKREKEEAATFSKAEADQNCNTTTKERQAYINYGVDSISTETSAFSSVEDGSQSILKTFDLNAIVN